MQKPAELVLKKPDTKTDILLDLIKKELLDHNVYTPFSLCREIINQLGDLNNKNILVLYSYEMAYLLVKEYKCDPVNITLVGQATNKVKTTLAQKLGINYCDVDWINNTKSGMNMKFDVIVGNPPYQDANSNPLYYKFHNMAVKHLLELNGIMSMITPDSMAVALETGIVKGCHTVELREILTLNISTDIKTKYFKDVGVNNFCYYIIKNTNKTIKPYEIITDEGVSLGIMSPLKPLINNPVINTILSKCFEYDSNVYNGGWFTAGKSAIKDDNGTSKVALNIDQSGNIVTYTVNYTKPHKLQNKPKVFITGFGNRAAVAYDHTLVCASEKLVYTVITNSDIESENLVHLIDCKLKFFLTKVIKARGPYIDFLRHFRGVPLTSKWTDSDLYKHFNLTQEEIDYIESMVK